MFGNEIGRFFGEHMLLVGGKRLRRCLVDWSEVRRTVTCHNIKQGIKLSFDLATIIHFIFFLI